MTTRKYLLINSNDREQGTPSDFKIKLPYAIPFKCCELIYCMVANTFYNITDANNKIIIDNITYAIPQGNYNLDEFLFTFQLTIETVQAITFNDNTGQLVITMPAVGANISFPSVGSIAYVLGFSNDYNATTVYHTSTNTPSLIDTEFFIDVQELSGNFMTTSNTYLSPTFCIPNNTNKNDLNVYYKHSQYPQHALVRDDKLQWLNIRLKNQYGEILKNASEWSFLLEFY